MTNTTNIVRQNQIAFYEAFKQNKTSFKILPYEVFQKILTLLSNKDLQAACQVSRTWCVEVIPAAKAKEKTLLLIYLKFLYENLPDRPVFVKERLKMCIDYLEEGKLQS